MGESRVKLATSQKQLHTFIKYLLKDVKALERMLDDGLFEIDKIRIGAEQELCVVDEQWKPSSRGLDLLDDLDPAFYTTELARFNIEANLTPFEFKGDCLEVMEKHLEDLVDRASDAAKKIGANVALTGILPTIRRHDLDMENLTPKERYFALCKAINKLRGGDYELRIRGIDELIMRHDSPLLEACNTGFQVHLQVTPDTFVDMYNIAQAITGPVLASAVNSPLLFGKRLWKESRVALFQQSVDTRKSGSHLRESSARVTFGNDWLKKSILEIYKEDIMRYRVLLSSDITEDVFEKLDSGTAPELMALKVHNSTVYRWNRPCYGISDGKPHLRIENRILPSGPSIPDEMANAAFWLGLMNGLHHHMPDISSRMDFAAARSNFVAAARLGLDTKMTWLNDVKINASTLIQEELLPIAEDGLKLANIDQKSINRYIDILNERVSTGKTGSTWIINSFNALTKVAKKEEALAAITASLVKNQKEGLPVAKWKMATLDEIPEWQPSSILVEEVMTTDLFTVQQKDIVELVSEIMDWQRIRYVPVENEKGSLVGLVTSRALLKSYGLVVNHQEKLPATVKDLMIKDPITISPNATIVEAMEIMDSKQLGCLPVVDQKKLVGVITEQNFLDITSRLLKRLSKRKK